MKRDQRVYSKIYKKIWSNPREHTLYDDMGFIRDEYWKLEGSFWPTSVRSPTIAAWSDSALYVALNQKVNNDVQT